MNEGTSLATSSVNGEWVTNGGLHQEAVQYRSVVTVVVEAVNQTLIQSGLGSLRSPNNSLVKVGNAKLVVGTVEGKEQLVKRLSQVIDRTRVGRVQDFALDVSVRSRYLHGEVTLRNWRRTRPAVTVNTHGAQVDKLDV